MPLSSKYRGKSKPFNRLRKYALLATSVLLLNTLFVAPARAAAPVPVAGYAPKGITSVGAATAVDSFIQFDRGIWDWGGAGSDPNTYKLEVFACDTAHPNTLTMPGDCESRGEFSIQYDIDANDAGKYMLGVLTVSNGGGTDTVVYMGTTGQVAGTAALYGCGTGSSTPLNGDGYGAGVISDNCTKKPTVAEGVSYSESGPLYWLISGHYSITVIGGNGASATYGGTTVMGGDGAEISFDVTTPVYTGAGSSWWNYQRTGGYPGVDSQMWQDSYCKDTDWVRSGDNLYYSSVSSWGDSRGGTRGSIFITVAGVNVAFATAGGGGGAGCNGGGGGGGSTPTDPPVAPTGVTAVGGNGSATISWSAVTGATSYRALANPGGYSCTTTTTSCTITGLTNGTSYTFTVVAIGPGGTSAASTPSSAVTPSAGGGSGGSGGFNSDPNLQFLAPSGGLTPGGYQSMSNGLVVGTTLQRNSLAQSLRFQIGGASGSTTTSSASLHGSFSGLPLRIIGGNPVLAPEQKGDLKFKLSGYVPGSQVQVYLSNQQSGQVTLLGYGRVNSSGHVDQNFQLPAELQNGDYILQVNGYGAGDQAINQLSVGTRVLRAAIKRIYFGNDASLLDSASKKLIDNVIRKLKSKPKVSLYAYTTGTPVSAFAAINTLLAQRRANAVRSYLVAKGVKSKRIVIHVIGAIAPRNTIRPWQSRRVDIYGG